MEHTGRRVPIRGTDALTPAEAAVQLPHPGGALAAPSFSHFVPICLLMPSGACRMAAEELQGGRCQALMKLSCCSSSWGSSARLQQLGAAVSAQGEMSKRASNTWHDKRF